jgi:hypothetical protein
MLPAAAFGTALAALMCVAGSAPASAPAAPTRFPGSIVVLGHSVATGYNSDPKDRSRDATENSWATGANPAVNSVYLRILAHNGGIRAHNFNLATDGSKVFDLLRQGRDALSLKPLPELVVVQTMDNDIRCDGTDPENYKRFRATLIRALSLISKGAPKAHFFLVSQWATVRSYANVIKHIPAARAENTGVGPCDFFDFSGRFVPARAAYLETIIGRYHAQLAAACARFRNCRYDRGALHRVVIARADLTPDFHHLSIQGNKKIATAAWAALYP